MKNLNRDHQIQALAKQFGLPAKGECVEALTAFAIRRILGMKEAFGECDLTTLRRVVTNQLRAKLEFIRSDADVDRIASQHSGFQSGLRDRLRIEFLEDTTEGLTLQRETDEPLVFRFLAIIDARGSRTARSYFTAWHEIVHLLLHPPQLEFSGFRRTPPQAIIEKDPVESLIDHVAGIAAFYPPIFGPVLDAEVCRDGGLTFRAIDAARSLATPEASLYASTLASIRQVDQPILFVTAENARKKHQLPTDHAELRAVGVIPNEPATQAQLAIHRNMRIPARSAIRRAHESLTDISVTSFENQSDWSTSTKGPLPQRPLRVLAVRRGRYVYALIAAA